jgi:serine/threonine protein kinase
MGVTYRALDTVLGHAVALKVIDTRIAGRPDARARFLREARAAARLRHPNVASVFYYGVHKSDGQCFLWNWWRGNLGGACAGMGHCWRPWPWRSSRK